MRMKIFLVQFCCLLLFGFDSKQLEKMFDVVYNHHAVVCISIFMMYISLRLVGLNIYFYDVFF